MNAFIEKNRPKIRALATKHGAYRVRLFGSFARGEETQKSDIDLLVDSGPKTSTFFPGGLIADLEDLLGKKVDVVTAAALPEEIKEQVLAEAVEL